MIPSVLFEIARNMYGAGGGAAHPSALASALYGLMGNDAFKNALRAGQAAHRAGASDAEIDEAYKYGLGDGLGWTHAETDAFWNDPNYNLNAEDAAKFDQDWDAFFDMVEHLKGGGR